MSDVKGRVVKPDVGFDADGAGSKGRPEGEGPPVVVVGVQGLRDNALGQVGGAFVEGSFLSVGENRLERVRERHFGS